MLREILECSIDVDGAFVVLGDSFNAFLSSENGAFRQSAPITYQYNIIDAHSQCRQNHSFFFFFLNEGKLIVDPWKSELIHCKRKLIAGINSHLANLTE